MHRQAEHTAAAYCAAAGVDSSTGHWQPGGCSFPLINHQSLCAARLAVHQAAATSPVKPPQGDKLLKKPAAAITLLCFRWSAISSGNLPLGVW